MPYTPPKFKSEGFNCPQCNYYAHQLWFEVYYGEKSDRYGNNKISALEMSECVKCKKYILWFDGKIIFPVVNGVQQPHPEMPTEVKTLYEEAKTIVSKSPRASTALLRTAVTVLVDTVMGKNNNSLNHNIGSLVKQKRLSREIQQSLDYLRVIGTHSLHPGLINMEEIEQNDYQHAASLFELINLIVEELIARPKKIKSYYDSLPESQKHQIKDRDSKTI
jgi:hypothetical protein